MDGERDTEREKLPKEISLNEVSGFEKVAASVIRFGEMLSLWHKFRKLWQQFKVHLVFGKVVNPFGTL